MTSAYYIIICACLLFLFLVWKEITRENKSRLVWRLISSALAIACLLALALPSIMHANENDQHDPRQVIWITKGFNRDSLLGFIAQQGQHMPLYTGDQQVRTRLRDLPVALVPGISFLSVTNRPAGIHIFGDGLQPDELTALHALPIALHSANAGPGPVAVQWTRKLSVGETFFIQGIFDNVSAGPVTLFLKGLHAIEDSVVIPAHTVHEFELRSVPKFTGRAVYAFIAVSGKDSIENDPIPFEVEPPQALTILVLASSPGFENRFLKNWLSQHGYAVTVFTGISRNKYDRQFLNQPKSTAVHLTPSYLDKFDLVLANGDELSSLNKPELESIRAAIEKKGLGLIVSADSTENKNNFYSKPFPLYQAKVNPHRSFLLSGADSAAGGFALNIENPVCIRYRENTQVLLQDAQGGIFVSSSMLGSGKIIQTTLANTYSLVLNGDKKNYELLWSQLLQKASRKTPTADHWQSLPDISYANSPVTLNLETAGDNLPLPLAGGSSVPLLQDQQLPFKWQGTYWPQQTGWHDIGVAQSATHWWYTYKDADWKKLLASQQINDTKKYISAHAMPAVDTPGDGNAFTMASMKIYFLLGFLFCCAFLWIEKKI